jgi:hypothetical protein
MCSSWPFVIKGLYRDNKVHPMKQCVLNLTDYTSSNCGFECLTDDNDVGDTVLKHYSEQMNVSKNDAASVLTKFICGGDGYKIFPGDHIESASPADPSFW